MWHTGLGPVALLATALTGCASGPDAPSSATDTSPSTTSTANETRLSDIVEQGLPDLDGDCATMYGTTAGYSQDPDTEAIAQACIEAGGACVADDIETRETAICVAMLHGLDDMGVHFNTDLWTQNGYVRWTVKRWTVWSEDEDFEAGTGWLIDGLTSEFVSREDFDAE